MSFITNKNAELPEVDNHGKVDGVKPVEKIDPQQADQFSDLMAKGSQDAAVEQSTNNAEMTPEELQREIRKNLFKNGFNQAIEKAKEIAKELRNG